MSEREKSDRPRFWTPGMIAVCSALGLVVLLFLLWLTLNGAAQRAVDREIAKIRARGEPATMEEVAPPPVPDEENAAVVFELAFAELAACESKVEADPDLKRWEYEGLKPFESERENMEKVAAIYAEPMRLAREALERPKCRFDLDYPAGFQMELPHLAKLRKLARVFRAEAFVHAYDARTAEAAESIVLILRLSRAFEEPLLISRLVAVSIEGMGVDTLKSVEKLVELPEDARRRIIAELGRSTAWAGLHEVFWVERVCGSDALTRQLSGETGAGFWGVRPPQGFTIAVRAFRFHFLRDHLRYLQVMTGFADASRLPLCEALPETRAIAGRIEGLPAWRSPLTRLLVPGLSNCVSRFARAEAQRNAAVLALAADLYHSAHGNYPDTLDALVPEFLPELPPDPFTGKPFIYRKRPDGRGFIVYSVGDNLMDDGGVFKQWEDGDILWRRAPAGETDEEPRKTRAGGAGVRPGAPPE